MGEREIHHSAFGFGKSHCVDRECIQICIPFPHNVICASVNEMKRNESGFRPPLCTYRLNWARRTSWGWWDECDDTVLQTQDSKFEPWWSEAEHATSRSQMLPTILIFTRGWGRNIFVSLKPPRPGTEPRTLAWEAAVLITTLGPRPCASVTIEFSAKQFPPIFPTPQNYEDFQCHIHYHSLHILVSKQLRLYIDCISRQTKKPQLSVVKSIVTIL